LVLDDTVGEEYENADIIIGNVTLADFATAYIDSHPEESPQYARILNSDDSREIKTLKMRSLIYGKMAEEIRQKQQEIFNPDRYYKWIAELRTAKWKAQAKFAELYSASDDTKAYNAEKIDEKKF